MNDSVQLWAFNVLLQTTCVSLAGLAIAVLFSKHATVKSRALTSLLVLLLVSPLMSAAMQAFGRSFISFDTRLVANDEVESDARLLSARTGVDQRQSTVEGSTSTAADEIEQTDEIRSPFPSDVDSRNRATGRFAGESELLGTPHQDTDQKTSADLTTINPRFEVARFWRELNRQHARQLVASLLISVWMIGAVLMLTRLVLSWRHLHGILNSAIPNADPTLNEIFARVCRELSLPTMPELLVSNKVSGPISAGLKRPRVVLPAQIAEQVSATNLHDVLVHEAAHILRRDQFAVLLQNLAGAIYWFHPFVSRLNRALSQAREEVCDNHVLRISAAPAYCRTLLTLAELVTVRPLPGAVGLFTSQWKLESRVGGLLDEQRNRAVELGNRGKLMIVALSVGMAMVAALGTVTVAASQNQVATAPAEQVVKDNPKQEVPSPAKDKASPNGPTLRGEGENREMLIRGQILDVDGGPARGFDLVAKMNKSQQGTATIPVKIDGNEFEVWVPISGSYWRHIELTVTAMNGSLRAHEGIAGYELRSAAVEGITLRLASTDRAIKISVTHHGEPAANAHVNVDLTGNIVLQGHTDAMGVATFRLRDGEKLDQITAWTDNFWIGGHSFDRKPRWDPLGDQFSIELDDCHDQKIRFLKAEDNSPVPEVPFELVLGTGEPDYNFAAVPSTFPHCRMKTNEQGEAIFRWFPNWKTHGAYVEIIAPGWAKAASENRLTVGDDGALVMTLKRRVLRQPFTGKVSSDGLDVGGLLVEIRSFQSEEENHSDHVYAFTDKAGNFTGDCIPGARYTVCVNDAHLASKMIDMIPFDPDTGKSHSAELKVSAGSRVEIYVTSGPSRRPMQNQRVYVRQTHSYSWLENGKKQNGTAGRDHPVFTDAKGVARTQALAGSELRITVYADDWRSDARKLTVKESGVSLVEIHREVDAVRNVKGHVLPPPGVDAQLADAEIIFGSIDGETDEREAIVADSQGNFAFKSKAVKLGIFAYTKDGKAAGVAKPQSLEAPVEIHLQPTMDLQGQLLGMNDAPLANHPVRVTPRVSGKSNFNVSLSTSFNAKTFETKTDANGNYTFKNLPTEFQMAVWADSIDGSKDDVHADNFYLIPGDQRPRMISRLGRARQPETLTFVDEYKDVLRDAKLGNFYVLVLSYDAAADGFVKKKILDHEANREVMSFLNLQIQKNSLTTDSDREFAKSKSWPQPVPGKVFACVLDATGKELGRTELDTTRSGDADTAIKFLREHMPPQTDAKARWDAAFAEAKQSGRRVWARVGQRYCGPCFRLSRWIDDHRALLERDYVLLKIDNLRDLHGAEIAKRIINNREDFSIPFYSIFDLDERVLIDSESPLGNIGHPSSFEGRRHLTKMFHQTRQKLTETEIDQIVETLVE